MPSCWTSALRIGGFAIDRAYDCALVVGFLDSLYGWGAPPLSKPGFTGHVTDAETGLSYMQARYYDPYAGRFLTVDPIAANPISFNRYWYANNNPYTFVDPDGRCTGSRIQNDNGSCVSSGSATTRSASARDEAAEITTDVRRDFIGRQAAGAERVADGAATAADVIDEEAVATVKYGWLGPVFGRLLSRFGRLFRVGDDAAKIAAGHAFEKHIAQFAALGISTKKQFAKHVDGVISNPSASRILERGRVAYWDQRSGTVVIVDPSSADGGTAFIPERGIDYFNDLR